MNFETHTTDGITFFLFREKRLDTSNSGLVKGELTTLLTASNTKRLVMDISEVESCDSSGLSALLVANRLMLEHGGKVRFVTDSPKVLTLIAVTHLDQVFTVCKTVQQAVSQLQN